MDQLSDKSNVHTVKPFVHHLLCPICSRCFDIEEDCFEHFLDHFENSKIFFFQRCNLVFWLNSYVRVTTDEEVTTISSTGDDNKLTESESTNAHHLVESEELQTYFCEICKISFLNEDQICIHNSVHIQVKVPKIDPQLKCPLCDHYACQEESCLAHIFTHMKTPIQETRTELSSTAQKTFQFIKQWIIVFLCSEFFDRILTKYTHYQQRLNSPLLSKILWSEIRTLKNCKFCNNPVTSVFELLDNHDDCKPYNVIKSVFCIICNFKAPDMDTLMLHFFSNHVVCYCGYSDCTFDSFKKHSGECVAHKSGIMCPCCHTKNFFTEGAFKEHIEGTKRKSCGAQLKKNRWVCMICKKQCSKEDMFNHILIEHVSCLCGYKSKDFKYFFIHTTECVTKKNNIFCPICRKTMCSTEAFLQQHVSRCLPWKELERNELLQQIEGGDEKLKRKHEQFVEKVSKRKFNFELNCINCASQ